MFFIFRIATISNAMVYITINSSYVLISIILSVKLGSDESASPNYLGKYIIFYIKKYPHTLISKYVLKIIVREDFPLVI